MVGLLPDQSFGSGKAFAKNSTAFEPKALAHLRRMVNSKSSRNFGRDESPLVQEVVPTSIAGWSSPVARQAHNLKAAGSNPAPATPFFR